MGNWDKQKNVKMGSDGGSLFDVLNYSGLDKAPERFKLVEGTMRLQFLPFVITTKMHPLVADKQLEIGDQFYNIALTVHKNVGANKSSQICPKKNFGKPCPICEAGDVFYKAGDKISSSALWPARRLFYNVVDMAEVEKGVQIFETSEKGFGKKLLSAQSAAERDPDMIESCPDAYFADVENGMTVKVVVDMATFINDEGVKSTPYPEASSITMAPRKRNEVVLVSELAEAAIPLDACVTLKSYEELEALFTGGSDEDDAEDTPQVKKPNANKVVENYKPAKDEKPVKKVVEEDVENRCPNGHVFGKDNGGHKDCDDCPLPLYKKCRVAGKEELDIF